MFLGVIFSYFLTAVVPPAGAREFLRFMFDLFRGAGGYLPGR
jgi:hypothetical protein